MYFSKLGYYRKEIDGCNSSSSLYQRIKRLQGLVIGGLDIFFFAFISGASTNPARSLAPALTSGVLDNLWLYWSATFIGTSIVALHVRNKLL
jgi:aquaporin Z